MDMNPLAIDLEDARGSTYVDPKTGRVAVTLGAYAALGAGIYAYWYNPHADEFWLDPWRRRMVGTYIAVHCAISVLNLIGFAFEWRRKVKAIRAGDLDPSRFTYAAVLSQTICAIGPVTNIMVLYLVLIDALEVPIVKGKQDDF